jgi:hypothetical protein
VADLNELCVTAGLAQSSGLVNSPLEWRGRAIVGYPGWKGELVGDGPWRAALDAKRHLTLRFPGGGSRRFLVAYVNAADGSVDVWGEGDLPETTPMPKG